MSGMLFQYPGLPMTLAGAAEILVNPSDWPRCLSAGLLRGGVALVVSAAVGLAKGVRIRSPPRQLCVGDDRVLLSVQLDLPSAHRRAV